MERPQFGIPCPGEHCPLQADSHCHMPLEPHEDPNSNLELTDAESLAVRAEILGAYDGLTDEQRVWQLIECNLGYVSVRASDEVLVP